MKLAVKAILIHVPLLQPFCFNFLPLIKGKYLLIDLLIHNQIQLCCWSNIISSKAWSYHLHNWQLALGVFHFEHLTLISLSSDLKAHLLRLFGLSMWEGKNFDWALEHLFWSRLFIFLQVASLCMLMSDSLCCENSVPAVSIRWSAAALMIAVFSTEFFVLGVQIWWHCHSLGPAGCPNRTMVPPTHQKCFFLCIS